MPGPLTATPDGTIALHGAIGDGNHATVYAGTVSITGVELAVKVSHPGSTSRLAVRREAATLRRLNPHPNIVATAPGLPMQVCRRTQRVYLPLRLMPSDLLTCLQLRHHMDSSSESSSESSEETATPSTTNSTTTAPTMPQAAAAQAPVDVPTPETAPDSLQRLPVQALADGRVVRALATQLIAAVRHAHRLLIFHLDIRPENILVDLNHTARLRLADFSMSWSPASADAATSCPLGRRGTPAYAAPEVWHATHSKATTTTAAADKTASAVTDTATATAATAAAAVAAAASTHKPYDAAAADAWSVGVVLFALLFGRPPWQSTSHDDAAFAAWDGADEATTAATTTTTPSQPSTPTPTPLDGEPLHLVRRVSDDSSHSSHSSTTSPMQRLHGLAGISGDAHAPNDDDTLATVIAGLLQVDPRQRMRLDDASKLLAQPEASEQQQQHQQQQRAAVVAGGGAGAGAGAGASTTTAATATATAITAIAASATTAIEQTV